MLKPLLALAVFFGICQNTFAKASTDPSTDVQCLGSAVYYEARGESLLGQKAVVEVILNRVKRRGLSICEVVLQNKQFSFVSRRTQWLSEEASEKVLKALSRVSEAVGKCATHYHNHTVQPKWAQAFVILRVIGGHIFYGRRECVSRYRSS